MTKFKQIIKTSYFLLRVKPYRTPPPSNIQSSATQESCGVVFIFFFCIIFLQYIFFQLKNSFSFSCQSRSIFFLYVFIYRNVIPRNLNSLLRPDVAVLTLAVWFTSEEYAEFLKFNLDKHIFLKRVF